MPTTGLAQTSPDQATLEGSNCTSMWVLYELTPSIVSFYYPFNYSYLLSKEFLT